MLIGRARLVEEKKATVPEVEGFSKLGSGTGEIREEKTD
jgi:hypothetical protein